jgi:glycosyltransferase involved in cell wall biosynthesis
MRIGFNARVLSHDRVRGLVRYTTNLIRALQELPDTEIVLFAKEPLNPQHLEGLRVRVVTQPAPRETLWTDWVLPRLIRHERIDVFHAPADRELPLRKPCPLIVTVHGSYERAHWRQLFQGWKRRAWYWRSELVNRWRADVVLTVSDTTRDALEALRVAPPRRLRRVHLAAAPEFSDRAEAGDRLVRDRHDLAEPYVLYVGGYDARKNVDGLVTAFDRSGLTGHRLVVVADKQWEYETLRERWGRLSCFPRLRLIEASPAELPAIYRGAQFFASPSLWESFGLPILEAMACGTPVLAARRTAIPEIAGDAALLIDTTDVQAFTSALQHLAATPAAREDLRARGARRAREFSWSRTAAETREVYREVLSGWPRRRSSAPGIQAGRTACA